MLSRRRFLQAALAIGVGSLWPAFAYSPRSSLQAVREALEALRSQRRSLPAVDGFTEFRGVIHTHTGLSHDSGGTMAEILTAAQVARLSFLIITDHYTPRIYSEGFEGFKNSILVLRGVEIGMGCLQGAGIGRRCGSVLALGLREPLLADEHNAWDWEQLFKTIRAQRALSIVAHSRGLINAGYLQPADGMEIYDIADAMRDHLVDVPKAMAEFMLASADYPEEVLLPLVERMNWNLVQWDRLTITRRFIGLAGNDAHQNLALFGRYVDRYDLMFRMLNTHVLAPALTTEDLIGGLREGRCFASFGILADAKGFQFVARESSTGMRKALMGEELKMQEGLLLHAQCPVPASVVLFRDGVPIRRQEGRELTHMVDRPGVYRVEVALKVMDRWRPWIFANPIYVRA